MIDIQDSIKIVWLALEGYRQFVIPEGSKENDQAWDDVCTAMAIIQEDLDLEEISL